MSEIVSNFGIGQLSKTEVASAEHAVDFAPPIYNIWKNRVGQNCPTRSLQTEAVVQQIAADFPMWFLQPAPDGAEDGFSRGVQRVGEDEEFFDRESAFAGFDALNGPIRPSQLLGQRALSQAGAITSLQQHRTQGAFLAMNLSGDGSGHAAPIFEGRVSRRRIVFTPRTESLYAPPVPPLNTTRRQVGPVPHIAKNGEAPC